MFSPGQTVGGRYRLEQELGAGATCRVFRAIDIADRDRLVALKLFSPHAARGTLESQVRFRREALLLGGLGHPNIVRVLGLGEHEQAPYLAMELLDGSLESWLADLRARREGPLGFADLVRLLLDVTRGLAFAHARGVVHRDIKPANVLLRRGDGPPVATLGDFGVALLTRGQAGERGHVIGTPGYMSPEQCYAVDAAIDERSDLFSLGVLAHELATGARPFPAHTLATYVRAVAGAVPPSARGKRPDLPPAFDAFVARLLARSPSARYQSAAGAYADLERIARSPDVAFELGLGDGHGRLASSAPLGGRESAREALSAAWSRAEAGVGSVVVIAGPAGIGKTRLVEELGLEVPSKGLALSGRCLSFEARTPFGVLVDTMRDLASHADVAMISARLAAELSDLDDSLVRAVPELGRLLGAPGGSGAPAEHERLRVREALVRVFLAVARVAGPTFVFFDGVDWADEDSHEVIAQLAREVATVPLVLVLAAREPAPWLDDVVRRGDASRLDLEPLSPAQVTALVSALLSGGGGAVVARVAEHVGLRAAGNPSFVEEQIRGLVASGILRADDSGWQCDDERLAASEPPRDVAAAIVERVARLPEDVRRVVAMASVVGRHVPFATLLDLTHSTDSEAMILALDEAVRASLLARSAEGTYSFGCDRTLDAVYAALPEEERVALHRALLTRLESRPDETTPADLLRHSLAVGDGDRSLRYARAAARDAAQRHAHLAAAALLEQAIPLAPPAERAIIHVDLAEARLYGGLCRVALDAARFALAGDLPAADRLRATRVLGAAHFTLGHYADATAALDRVLAEHGIAIGNGSASLARSALGVIVDAARSSVGLPATSSEGDELEAFDTLCRYAFFADATRFVEAALTAFRRLSNARDPGARMWAYASHAVVCRVAGLEGRADRCHAIAAALEDEASLFARARALPVLALDDQMRHRPVVGLVTAQRAEEAARRAGDPWSLTACQDMQCSMLLGRGDLVGAARAADRFLLAVEGMGVRQRRPRAKLLSTYLGWVLGRLDAAACAVLLTQADDDARAMGDGLTGAAVAWMDADVAIATGQLDRAVRRAEQGDARVRHERRLHPDALLAVATHARVLALTAPRSFGDRRRVRRLAEDAVSWGARFPSILGAGLAARAVALAASGARGSTVDTAVVAARVALAADEDQLRLAVLSVDLVQLGVAADDEGVRAIALLDAIGAAGVSRAARARLGLPDAAPSVAEPRPLPIEREQVETAVISGPRSSTDGATLRSSGEPSGTAPSEPGRKTSAAR